MLDIAAKLFSFVFIIVIYMFIVKIIQMVYKDIDTMSRRKTNTEKVGTYIKLLNIRRTLDFDVRENYAIKHDVTIGRSEKCGITIDDPFMSQRHAEIIVRDGIFYLSDLKSTNGTFLNGNEVTGDPIEIINGDKIEIGQLTFIFVSVKEKKAGGKK